MYAHGEVVPSGTPLKETAFGTTIVRSLSGDSTPSPGTDDLEFEAVVGSLSDPKDKDFCVILYGKTIKGASVSCRVKTSTHLYVELPTECDRHPSESQAKQIRLGFHRMAVEQNTKRGNKGIVGVTEIKYEMKKRLKGYWGNQTFPFLRLEVVNQHTVNILKSALSYRRSNLSGYLRKETQLVVHETLVDRLQTFYYEKDRRSCGWFRVPATAWTCDAQDPNVQFRTDICAFVDDECDIVNHDYDQHAPLTVLSWDLEVENDGVNMPDPYNHDNRILQNAFAIYDIRSKDPIATAVAVVWDDSHEPLPPLRSCGDLRDHMGRPFQFDYSLDTITTFICRDERELLERSREIFLASDPDFDITWNGSNFDDKYMWIRAKEEWKMPPGWFDWSRRINAISELEHREIETNQSGKKEYWTFEIEGRNRVDVLIPTKVKHKLPSYKLDAVGKALTGKRKVELGEASKIGLLMGMTEESEVEFTFSRDPEPVGESVLINPDELASRAPLNQLKRWVANLTRTIPVQEVEVQAPGVITEKVTKLAHEVIDLLSRSDDKDIRDEIVEYLSANYSARITMMPNVAMNFIAAYANGDTVVPYEIFYKDDLSTDLMQMAQVTGVQIKNLLFNGQGIRCTNAVAEKCIANNFVIPKQTKVARAKDVDVPTEVTWERDRNGKLKKVRNTKKKLKYKGAIVQDPVVGAHTKSPIWTLDFASLYPNIMIAENLSYETKVSVHVDGDSGCLCGTQWTCSQSHWNRNLCRGDPYGERADSFAKGNNSVCCECGEARPDVQPRERNPRHMEPLTDTNLLCPMVRNTYVREANVPVCCILIPVQPEEGDTEEVLSMKERAVFVQSEKHGGFDGIVPSILKEKLAARKVVKKKMAKAENDRDWASHAVFDKRQLGIKVVCNSMYGFMGSRTAKIEDTTGARATTTIGRMSIMRCVDIAENNPHLYGEGVRVVYGDTDSIFVDFNVPVNPGESHEEHVLRTLPLAQALTEHCNRELKGLSLDVEKAFKPLLLKGKKMYCGQKFTLDGVGRVIVKPSFSGFSIVRADGCAFVKRASKEVFQHIMDFDVEGAKRCARKHVYDLLSGHVPLHQLTMSKLYRKAREKYANPDSQEHLSVVSRMESRDPASAPKVGDRVSWVYVINGGGDTASKCAEDVSWARIAGFHVNLTFYLHHHLTSKLGDALSFVVEEPDEVYSDIVDAFELKLHHEAVQDKHARESAAMAKLGTHSLTTAFGFTTRTEGKRSLEHKHVDIDHIPASGHTFTEKGKKRAKMHAAKQSAGGLMGFLVPKK